VYAAVAAEAGWLDFDPIELNRRFARAWRAKTDFDYSRAAWADLVVRTFGGSAVDYGLESRLFNRLYDRFTEAQSWHVYEDVRPTLEALAARGLKCAVISNWDDRLRPLLKNLGLNSMFQLVIISGEHGHHKPAPELFARAVSMLELRPAELLHVGDSRREDVEGAAQAGLRAVLLQRDGEPGVGEIGSLLELPGLLE